MAVISEPTRELLVEVEAALKPGSRLQERVRDLRLEVDKMIEALKAS